MSTNDDKVPVLSRFVIGETSLLSKGVSYLKVTNDGKSELLALPIKSIGVADVQESFFEQMPKPPEKTKQVKKGTKEAQNLGIDEDTIINYLDFADSGYRQELRSMNDNLIWACILKALDIKFVDKDGNAVTDDDRKKAELIRAGITGHHIDQLMKDISDLSRTLEERADFLSKMLSV